jgi:predicted DNA-binding transcriptional regulator AlpA
MPAAAASAPSITYLTARQIYSALGISKQTLYRRIAAGEFPKPRKFGRTSRWSLDTVRDALRELPEELSDVSHTHRAKTAH